MISAAACASSRSCSGRCPASSPRQLRLGVLTRLFEQALALNGFDPAVLGKAVGCLGSKPFISGEVVKHTNGRYFRRSRSRRSFSLALELGLVQALFALGLSCAISRGSSFALILFCRLALQSSLFRRSSLGGRAFSRRLFCGLFKLPLFTLAPNLLQTLNCFLLLRLFFAPRLESSVLASLAGSCPSGFFGLFCLKLLPHLFVHGLLNKGPKFFLFGLDSGLKVA